jgi:predicted O-methyltransferase YrrM
VSLSNQEDAEKFISALYRGILRRQPAPSELEGHVAALLNGQTPTSVAEKFVECDEFKALNAVKLFVPPGHFYSPITDPENASRHLSDQESRTTPDAIPGIALNQMQMVEVWQSLLPYLNTIPFTENTTPDFRYYFNNPAYSWADGSILHAMLRLHRPKRLIEIGSGWSSACTLDTIEKYLDGDCKLTFVEPYPELLRNLIGQATGGINIIDRPVQQVSLKTFEALEAGDFLFIDSTHVLSTGSDVCFELFEILTRLPSGVFVHFHDMFWPFEYLRAWAVTENRSWNEVYAVRAFLTNNDKWRIIFFNDYFTKFQRPMIEATYPQFLLNSGGALWLQRL